MPNRKHLANLFLASLPPDDFAALLPYLETVDLKRGHVLYHTGDAITHAYLPHDCIVSLVTLMEDGQAVEMTALGREAMVGVVSAPATRTAIGEFVVQLTGCASRIPMADLDKVMIDRPHVLRSLRNVNEFIISQTLYSVACNAVHSVEARCCRWILSSRDRVGKDTLALTHEFLAEMIGVQRSTVSAILKQFQTAGFLEQKRGAIAIRDNAGLERLACECRRKIQGKIDLLLPRASADLPRCEPSSADWGAPVTPTC